MSHNREIGMSVRVTRSELSVLSSVTYPQDIEFKVLLNGYIVVVGVW